MEPVARHPFVSVIIPVYNERERLGTCLSALRGQSYPRDRYEVIVADNGSTDGTDLVAAQFPGIRRVSESAPGSYAARNRAIAIARGEVLAFTDADCIPAPDWIEKGIADLRRTNRCGLVGGKVELYYESPARPTTQELYQALFDFDQERCVTSGRYALTANLFTYADVIRQVGCFDARLKSVGDRDWGNRVAAAGYARVFSEEAVVRHPARSSLGALLARRRRVGGGHHDRAHTQRFPHVRFLVALVRQLMSKPIQGAARVWSIGPAITMRQKLKVIGLLTFLCWAEAAERVRLEVGGHSRR